jgi:putative transcriptional regulator
MGYAMGAAEEGTSVLVATHMALCPQCRDRVVSMEAVGGAMLDDQSVGEIDDAFFDDIMGKLDDTAPKFRHPMPSPAPISLEVLPNQLRVPEPLRSIIAQSGQRWRTVIPGKVRRLDLAVHIDGKPLRIMRVSPGFGVPTHTHDGPELNLILSGGYHDRGEDFARGDVAANDEADTHEFTIDAGEDCVILTANEGNLVPIGWRAHLANWLAGGL